MRKLLMLVLLAALAAALYVAYPFYTMQRIEAALRSKDTQTLDALIDWTKVRASARTDIMTFIVKKDSKKQAGSLGGILGTLMGGALIERMLDVYLSSTSMTNAENVDTAALAKYSLQDFMTGVRFVTPTVMHATFESPLQPGFPISTVLELDGITWRVTRVTLPWQKITEMAEQQGAK